MAHSVYRRIRMLKCGLWPVGAIRAYAPEVSRKKDVGIRVAGCGLLVAGNSILEAGYLMQTAGSNSVYFYLLLCLSCIGNLIMPLPRKENDGAKRFHHSSLLNLHSSFH